MIYVVGPKDKAKARGRVINTTSSAKNWSKNLSPFFLGPVQLYGPFVSENVENAWQYSKVYAGQLKNGRPTVDYWTWAAAGWNSRLAHRYPMGRGVRPLCSWWDGVALDYIEARKEIYIPLYEDAVRKSGYFEALVQIYESEKDITLFDFDGYDFRSLGMTFDDVIADPTRKMGHAFVLAMMLEGYL